MGRESRVIKDRTCQACRQHYYVSAISMKEHADMCKRMQEIGLVIPGIRDAGELRLIGGIKDELHAHR